MADTVYELPSPSTACLAPKLKLPPDEEWFETMTIEESRGIAPKAVLDILTEDGYDSNRYRNIRVLKKPREGHWCIAVDVYHINGLVKTLYALVAEWRFIRSYSILWHKTAQKWAYVIDRTHFVLHSVLAVRRYGSKDLHIKVLHQGPDKDGSNRSDVTLLSYGTNGDNMTGTNKNKSLYASSKYPFVSFYKGTKKWGTYIPFEKKFVCKFFKTEEDAWSFVQIFCTENKIPLGLVRQDADSRREWNLQKTDLFGTDENNMTWVLTIQDGQQEPRRMILGNVIIYSQIKPVVEACQNFVCKHKRPMPMDRHGRVRIMLQGRLEALHRHMFRFASGKNIHPGHQIDHFDHNKHDINPNNLGITTAKVNSAKQLGDGIYFNYNGFCSKVMAFGKPLRSGTFPTQKLPLEFVTEKKRAIGAAVVSCIEAALILDDDALVALVEKRAAEIESKWNEWYTKKC